MSARRAAIRLALEGGPDVTETINPRLSSLSLSERREAEADELEVRLQNADGRLEIPEPGAVLTLAMGWTSGEDVPIGLVDKGRFIVDEVGEEGSPDIVTFKARSAEMTGALRQRRTKSWKELSLGSILEDIAARHGRGARIDPSLAALHVDAIEQEGKSDMAFIRDLGRRYDAIATWKDRQLIFLPIGKSATAGGTPLDTFVLTRRDGGRWSFNQASRENYDGASAQWHDQDAGRRRTVHVGGENRRKLKRVYASESEARQAAEAAAKRSGREPYRFTYELAIAEPALQPDMRVRLRGWREKIDSLSWLVQSVTTEFGGGGFRQSIEMEGDWKAS